MDNGFNQEDFFENLNSTLLVKRDYQNMQYDYEWLERIEEALPYIDNILRNPKRFIINEEEIVKVEQSKKTTVESIIHLTQHTNFIQEYNEDTNEVKPSKVLNINKDESLDTYENRFIYTLIENLRLFYQTRCKESGLNSLFQDKKYFNYTANTKIGIENMKVDVIFSSVARDSKEIVNERGETISDRLKKTKTQLDGFTASELHRTLTHLNVSPVRSPIKKTNVILKNPNFQQAEKLCNYIQTFESKDKTEKEKKDYLDDSELRNQYNQLFMMLYTANGMIENSKDNKNYDRVITEMIDRFIENIIESAAPINEDELKSKVNKEIDKIKTVNREKRKSIYTILRDRLDSEEKNITNMIYLLTGDYQ